MMYNHIMMISIEDLKAHLRIDFDLEDDLILAKRDAAIGIIENYTGQSLSELDTVPAPINEALRKLVSHFYEHRGLTNADQDEIERLIMPYRAWRFA